MLKVFLGILAVILAVALLTNNSEEQALPQAPVIPAAGTQEGASGAEGTAGVNPPHGQPGHRCDIAVGAPLPGSAAAPAAPQNTSPRKAGTSAAVNPPHGQPGHDCAVPVGAPLPQK